MRGCGQESHAACTPQLPWLFQRWAEVCEASKGEWTPQTAVGSNRTSRGMQHWANLADDERVLPLAAPAKGRQKKSQQLPWITASMEFVFG